MYIKRCQCLYCFSMAINAAVFPYVMFKVINFKDILIINIYPEIEQTQDMMFKCIFIPQLTAYSLHKTKYQCMLTSSMHNAFMVSYILDDYLELVCG